MSDATAGLEARYEVRKINDRAGKHNDCRYFVLDPQHDPGARFALRAYMVWARNNEFTALASDLRSWLNNLNPATGTAHGTTEPQED